MGNADNLKAVSAVEKTKFKELNGRSSKETAIPIKINTTSETEKERSFKEGLADNSDTEDNSPQQK